MPEKPVTRLIALVSLLILLTNFGFVFWRIEVMSTLVQRVERHLTLQDGHMQRQDAEADDRLKNQVIILENQRKIMSLLGMPR